MGDESSAVKQLMCRNIPLIDPYSMRKSDAFDGGRCIFQDESERHVGPTELTLLVVGNHLIFFQKIGYIPNYSHLIGIMIINHWV